MTDFLTNSASLKLKPFEKPIALVMKELAERPDAMEDLMIDPAGFMMLRISPSMTSQLPKTTINAANKFLYSALANEPFRKWLFAYNDQLISEVDNDDFAELDDVKIRADLAEALLQHGDTATLNALLGVPQTPVFPGSSDDKSCCCSSGDDDPFPVPDPFGPRPNPEAAAVAVVVLVVAVVSVAVAALAVAVADTPYESGLKSNRMKAFSMTGQELTSVSEAIVLYSERMRAAGKI